MKINYQIMLDSTLAQIQELAYVPKLLLHSCCAPCSTYVLEYLSKYFDITVYYYNPNIFPQEEFDFRLQEQIRLANDMHAARPVSVVGCNWSSDEFYAVVAGLESEPEGGKRCEECFRLRLGKTAEYAADNGFDYFTTTLSISPHKNAQLLNALGEEIAGQYGIKYLHSDFKKNNGYKRSCELSADFGLYRQDYCGCVYSKTNR